MIVDIDRTNKEKKKRIRHIKKMTEEEESNSKKRKAENSVVDENRLNYQKQRCEELKAQLDRLDNGRCFFFFGRRLEQFGLDSPTFSTTQNQMWIF